MALLDISLVTRALINLVRESIESSPAWSVSRVLNVTPLPPDRLSGDHAVGLYLYHIMEAPQHKNLPPAGSSVPPIRFTPMGLNLHFQLTTRSDLAEPAGPLEEQLMMGLAMKALRDTPVIDDSTRVRGVTIMPAEALSADNRFRISLQPLPHTDSVTYWTAGSSPLRLAAYYEVAVALLEPERPTSYTGRVLTYGVYSFVTGAPRLDTSRSTLTFTPPGQAQMSVEVQPAQAPSGGQVIFYGTNLSGTTTILMLRSPEWDEAVEADPTWQVAASDGRVFATVQRAASGRDIVPGVYTAFVRVIRERQTPDGSTREFSSRSNETPFQVMPSVTGVAGPDANLVMTVSGGVFQHASIRPEAVQVFIGALELQSTSDDPPAAGQFRVVDPATIQFVLPAGLPPAASLPLRIFVNGVENPPVWVQTP